MGSKNRIAKHLIPIMVDAADKEGITTWVEPMVGGGNMIDKVPNRFKRIGYDYNEHTIMAMLDIRDRAKKGNLVFVSEYEAPDDFECVWQGEQKTNFASTRKKATHNAVEKLFIYKVSNA